VVPWGLSWRQARGAATWWSVLLVAPGPAKIIRAPVVAPIRCNGPQRSASGPPFSLTQQANPRFLPDSRSTKPGSADGSSLASDTPFLQLSGLCGVFRCPHGAPMSSRRPPNVNPGKRSSVLLVPHWSPSGWQRAGLWGEARPAGFGGAGFGFLAKAQVIRQGSRRPDGGSSTRRIPWLRGAGTSEAVAVDRRYLSPSCWTRIGTVG
jgi:hypothetical protein